MGVVDERGVDDVLADADRKFRGIGELLVLELDDHEMFVPVVDDPQGRVSGVWTSMKGSPFSVASSWPISPNFTSSAFNCGLLC